MTSNTTTGLADTSGDRFALFRVRYEQATRWAGGTVAQGPEWLLHTDTRLVELLAAPTGIADAAMSLRAEDIDGPVTLLAPLDDQEVWASGVTFERSRVARGEEAQHGDGDVYDRVYAADRPELFFKASAAAVRGPNEAVGIRADSTWSVPEPELALLIAPDCRIVAATAANDMSSRSIEGENPLYLPQAKVYRSSCALGPCLVPVDDVRRLRTLSVGLEIRRTSEIIFSDTMTFDAMRRSFRELTDWLFRALDFPHGVVLLTGTSIVPRGELTLQPGDRTDVVIEQIGRLSNPVELVG